jgi:hypothetical protein
VKALQKVAPALGVGLLAAAEHDRHLDLVALLEKAGYMALFSVVIVGGDLRPQFDLTDVDLGLVLLGGLELLLLLVLVLRVVEQPGDRRLGSCGDFNQVEVSIASHLTGVVGGDDPDLLTVSANQPDLGYADTFVDTSGVPFRGTAVEPARYRH